MNVPEDRIEAIGSQLPLELHLPVPRPLSPSLRAHRDEPQFISSLSMEVLPHLTLEHLALANVRFGETVGDLKKRVDLDHRMLLDPILLDIDSVVVKRILSDSASN